MKAHTLPSILALASLLNTVNAYFDPKPPQYCFLGCQEAVSAFELPFAGSPTILDPYPEQQCLNELFVESVFVCAKLYCLAGEIDTGAWYADLQCPGGSIYNTTTRAAIDSLSSADLAAIPRLDYGYTTLDTVNTTIVPSQDMFDLADRTINVWYTGRTNHLWYSHAMYIFWAAVVLTGIIHNFVSHLRPSVAFKTVEGRAVHAARGSKVWRFIQSRLLLPATFDHKCSVPAGQCTIPPRGEAVAILAFVILNIVLCAISYEAFPQNLYFDQVDLQIWRYFSDRTGYLSYANLAICWLFAIRNNILIHCTGWNFATFNRFHRWVARLATLEAVLHSIGYTAYAFQSGGYEEYAADFVEQYWYTGVIATVAMSLMMGFSVLYLRVKFYDTFLLLHIALSLIALVNLFYHTKIFSGQFDGWLWSCVAFWVFDRVCRIGRVFYLTCLNRGFRSAAEYDETADLIRIDVTGTCSRSRAAQSGYFFLYSPLSLLGWESHPFTLVRWKQALETQPECLTPMSVEHDSKASTTIASESPVSHELVDRYSLLVRPYDGYTSRLRRSLRNSTALKKMNFLLEGPYGHSPDLRRASEVWFFVGGSGISVAITSIYGILEKSPSTAIRLVWSSRSSGLIDTVLDRELAVALKCDNFAIDAYITGDRASLRAGNVCRSVAYNRPDVPEIIRAAADKSSGHLAVVVCGPDSLTDDARAAFCTEMRAGDGEMSLFVESFNW